MKSFLLKISSPDGDVFCGKAVNLSVRTAGGDIAIMDGHIPFVSYVRPCDCKISLEDGSVKTGRIESGVLTVSAEKVILLSGNFKWN